MLKSPSAEESSSNSTPSRNHLVSPLKNIPAKESPFSSSTAVESPQPALESLVDSELNGEASAVTHTTIQNTDILLDNGSSTSNQEVDKPTNESPRFTPAKRPFQPSPVKTPASAIQTVEPIPAGKILQSPDLLSQVSINQPSPMAQQQQQQPHVFPGVQPQFRSPVQQQQQQEPAMPTLQSSNSAFPPKTPQSTSAILSISQPSGFTDFSEFDPLANNLMSFQSPLPMPKAHNSNGTSGHLLHNVLKKQAVATPPPSLLDIAPMVLSPSRVLKYSETDVAAMKKEWSDKVEKEAELVQIELQQLDEKYKKEVHEREQMQIVLRDYEQVCERLHDELQKEKEKSQLQIEKITDERNRLQLEVDAMEISFKELRLRYEDMKVACEGYSKNEQAMKELIERLKNDVLVAAQRYDTLKQHAEEKLEAANHEIHTVRSTNSKQLASLSAKLARSEMKVKSLESTMEIKTRENQELTGICDELIAKLDEVAGDIVVIEEAGNEKGAEKGKEVNDKGQKEVENVS